MWESKLSFTRNLSLENLTLMSRERAPLCFCVVKQLFLENYTEIGRDQEFHEPEA